LIISIAKIAKLIYDCFTKIRLGISINWIINRLLRMTRFKAIG